MTYAHRINGVLRRFPTWPLYLLAPVPALIYFYWAVTNQLGPDPLVALERQLGRWALQLLLVTLLVTPIRKLTGVSFLKFRRALGLSAFLYICFHLLTWFVLDKQFFWGEILKDLTKRPFIVMGMIGFLLLLPLALTSNKFSIRRLGPQRWNYLHRLSYIAVILGAVHFTMVRKVWEVSPLLYVAAAVLLVSWRLPWKRIWPSGLKLTESQKSL
jgi:methionine sulfoxide reductase heme-binding subunit